MSERSETKRTRIAANLRRLTDPPRLPGVDLARGLAVLGMFAAHLIALPDDLLWTDSDTWSAVASGRSSIVFATIAGVSIGLTTGARVPLRGEAMTVARGRLGVRAGLLLALGILLVLTGVPVYVILPAYAFLFALAIPLTSLSAPALFAIAGAIALVMPFVQAWIDAAQFWSTPEGNDLGHLVGWHYPFPTWIAFVAAGLACARAGLRRPGVQWAMLLAGSALAAIGYGADALSGVPEQAETDSVWAAVWTARAHSTGLLEVVGSGGFAVAVIGACLLLCRSRVATTVLLPLRSVGATPLTAYVGQLVVWAVVAAVVLGDAGDLAGFRALQPFWPFVVATVVLCSAWAVLVGRGPLEAAVDRVTRFLVPTEATRRW